MNSTCTIQGQTHTISAPLPVTLEGSRCRGQPGDRARRVRGELQRHFSRLLPDTRRYRLAAHRRDRPPARNSILRRWRRRPASSLEAARRGTRPVWFAGGWREAVDLVAARSAGRRRRRGARRARAARCDDGGRSRPRRPRRRARQSRSSRGRRHDELRRPRCCSATCRTISSTREGAYGRAGQAAPEIAALPARLAPLADSCAPGAAGSSRPISRSCPRRAASRSSRRI